MRCHWTQGAVKHLSAIHEHLAQTSPTYARETVERLTSRSHQVLRFPLSGRKVPEYEIHNVREVIEGHYRIIYRVLPEQVDVLAVIHTARQLPRKFR